MRSYLKKMKGKGKCPPRKPFSKIVWSWLGAFVAIYLISLFDRLFHAGTAGHLLLVGSFGASAVLVYGAPQAEFSQPRHLVGGHIISALVGISVYKLFPGYVPLASALAVSLSIALMHLTRTLHPPGGATALIAVVGSAEIHALGYLFVLSPVTLGAVIILLVALVINNLSGNPQRHYPVFWY